MRHIQKRCLCALLAVLLAVALCACGPVAPEKPDEPVPTTVADPEAPPAPVHDTLTLPLAKRDVLNPYKAATELNLELGALLYEGLFLTDGTHKARPVLAEGIQQASPTQWTVTLAKRKFHNGKAVRPADVIYSWQQAQASANFNAHVENIASMQEKDGKVEIALKSANIYIAANLDFPIVPDGSAAQGALKQPKNGYLFTKAGTPVGTGRYKLAAEDGVFYLAYNEDHPGPKPKLTTIALFGVNNSASLLYGLEMGNYQFVYSGMNDGKPIRVSAATARVPTTNLVYLGMNASRGALGDAALRAALAACIDGAAVIGDAYHGYADAVSTPFPPGWFGLKAEDFASVYDAAAARKNLESLGYTQLKDGVRASAHRKLQFTLLVSKGNAARRDAAKAIQAQLRNFQVDAQLKALPAAEFAQAVKAGAFDLYLGEVRLTPDCGLSPLLLSGGAAAKGVQVWGKASSAYGQLLQGLIKPAKFVSVFQADMPFMPLGYRCGVAAAARSLRFGPAVRRGDLFCDIAKWTF